MGNLMSEGQSWAKHHSLFQAEFEIFRGKIRLCLQYKSYRDFFLAFHPYKEQPNPTSRAPNMA